MTRLISAVKAKDKDQVEKLLENGADPNENGAGGKDAVRRSHSVCGLKTYLGKVWVEGESALDCSK